MEIIPDLCLEWKGISYSVPAYEENNYKFWQACRKKEEINILHNVNGSMKTGDMVAILGSSGAGKTTLLAAISQRLRGNLTGDIVLNGVAIDRTEMTRISSFLPQFEISVKTFTAFEHLYYMSHFKMHRKTTKAQKLKRVNDLLRTVGLRESANTMIKHLSGGERKRLSLAEELITNPPFLFCDEPTTGLDSFSAYTVVKTLRQLCNRKRRNSISSKSSSVASLNKEDIESSIEMEILSSDLDLTEDHIGGRFGKSVICSIHQPTSDIFELFTHVVLMDSGRIIYQGTTDDALLFFENLGFHFPQNCNPADFYLKTISDSHNENGNANGDVVKLKYDSETSGLYSGSWLLRKSYSTDYLQRINKFEKISWIFQVYLLLVRFITEDRRNIRECITNLGFYMVTSVTIAIMYSGVTQLNQLSVQDIAGSIFLFTTEVIFTASYGIMWVFPGALPIIRREVGEGTYSLSAFYVATVLSLIPVAFFKSYLFFGVIYASVGYTKGWLTFFSMGLVLSLAGIAGAAYGIFISCIFEKEVLASEMAAPFDLLFMIFGGVYYNVNSLPFLKYLSLFYYSNEALMYDFWIDIKDIECPQNVNHPCLKTGVEVLERKSFQTASYTFGLDCAALVVLAAVFHVLGFFLIRKYVKRTGYY